MGEAVRNKKPIYMLNLLSFKSKVNRHIYKTKYSSATVPLIIKLGGSPAFFANDGQVLIDTLRVGGVDEVALVMYPSLQTFTEMIASDAYEELNKLRLAAMDGGHLMLIPTQ